MKLPAGVKVPKLSRNTWIGIGAAGVAAVAYFLSTRGGARSFDPFAQPTWDDSQLGAGATEPDESPLIRDAIVTAPSPFTPPASETPEFFAPPAVRRTAPASSAPASSVVAEPASLAVAEPAYYVDRSGKKATLAEIFAQTFPVVAAPAVSSAVNRPAARTTYQAPAPQRTMVAPSPVETSSIPDRFRHLFGLPAAAREGYSQPPASTMVVTYANPIVARSLKTPGGGLAYPAGVETYIGGGGQDLVQRRGEWSGGSAPAASGGYGGGDAMIAA